MNEVMLQSSWIGVLQETPPLEGMRVRKNQSFVGQYLIGGPVEVHCIGDSLKLIEKTTRGSLSRAECRFVTRLGDVSTSSLNKLGFVFKDKKFIFKKQDFEISLTRIDNEHNYIWKVDFQVFGYVIPETLGQILFRLISLIKYEADIKPQPAYLRVVG